MQLESSLKQIIESFTVNLPGITWGRRAAEVPLITPYFQPLTDNQNALYDMAGSLYLRVRNDPAGSEQDCVDKLARWIADQGFSVEELTIMKAVFEERERRNNEGSTRGGALCSSLCSESSKYRWILGAIAEALT
jgi:hypothetical protein